MAAHIHDMCMPFKNMVIDQVQITCYHSHGYDNCYYYFIASYIAILNHENATRFFTVVENIAAGLIFEMQISTQE